MSITAALVALLQIALVGYLPGAALYRLPFWRRDRRAALDAEERVFWHVHLSLAWSLSLVLALAAIGEYTFNFFEAFTAATVIYIIVAMTANRVMAYIERKVSVPGYIGGGK